MLPIFPYQNFVPCVTEFKIPALIAVDERSANICRNDANRQPVRTVSECDACAELSRACFCVIIERCYVRGRMLHRWESGYASKNSLAA